MTDKPKPEDRQASPDEPDEPDESQVVYWDFTPGKPVRDIDNKLSDLVAMAAPATAEERAQIDEQARIALEGQARFLALQKDHERRGDPLVTYSIIALFLVEKGMTVEETERLLINSVRLGGLRDGRDLINPLTGLPPDEPELWTNTFFMAAPRSVWTAWLEMKNRPTPEEWKRMLVQKVPEEPVDETKTSKPGPEGFDDAAALTRVRKLLGSGKNTKVATAIKTVIKERIEAGSPIPVNASADNDPDSAIIRRLSDKIRKNKTR